MDCFSEAKAVQLDNEGWIVGSNVFNEKGKITYQGPFVRWMHGGKPPPPEPMAHVAEWYRNPRGFKKWFDWWYDAQNNAHVREYYQGKHDKKMRT